MDEQQKMLNYSSFPQSFHHLSGGEGCNYTELHVAAQTSDFLPESCLKFSCYADPTDLYL